MNDIGSQLRAAREVKGLTLEQAFKTTRIKVAYLEAIEANQIDVLPGLVQARGFVRSYANFLGLDGEQLASALDAEKASVPEVRPLMVTPAPSKLTPPPVTPGKPAVQPTPKPSVSIPVKPSPSDRPPERSLPPLQMPKISLKPSKPVSSPVPSGSGIPTSVLIIGAAVLFILGALLIIAALTAGGQSPAPQAPPNVPASFDPVLPAARTLAGLLSSGPVSITLKAGEHVWARITADGQTVFAGMLEPNTARDWEAKHELIVETGNAAALTVNHQGQATLLGKRGQIVARAFGANGSVDVPLAVSNDVQPHATTIATGTLP